MTEDASLWTYISVNDFDVPTPPASDAARGRLLRVWKSIQEVFHGSQQKSKADSPRRDRPADELMQSLSTELDWKHAAFALAETLGDNWFKTSQPARLIRPVIGPPGCDITRVLELLIQDRQVCILAAPAAESLLELASSDAGVADAVDDVTSELIIVPDLQRWYLRHEDGLTTLRKLVDRLIASQKKVLIGCDSWAWVFLQHAIGLEDMLGHPLTLAPLNAERLDAWFRDIFPMQQYEFRQTDNDELVFPPATTETHRGEQGRSQRRSSDFLACLAAEARGNPGVAVALWRACLRAGDSESDASPSQDSSAESVLWVVPPNEAALPRLPADIDRIYRFILHSLLLHDGLSRSLLVTVLPFSRDEIQRRVSELRRAGLVVEQNCKLRVPLTAYQVVRADLKSAGLLIDAF